MKQVDIFEKLHEADPLAMAADATMLSGMVGCGNRNGLSGNTDRLPMAYRPGALDADACPSRVGGRLYYRDGRVELVK